MKGQLSGFPGLFVGWFVVVFFKSPAPGRRWRILDLAGRHVLVPGHSWGAEGATREGGGSLGVLTSDAQASGSGL